MSTTPSFHIALVEPEIPQNCGNIGRLALGLGARVHLVHPLGFRLDEKAVRRAGLDYWKHVDLQEHKDLSSFLRWSLDHSLFLFSTKATSSYKKASFSAGAVLVFGPESRGLPVELLHRHGAYRIPMTGNIRSLNLANAVAVASYEASAQICPELF